MGITLTRALDYKALLLAAERNQQEHTSSGQMGKPTSFDPGTADLIGMTSRALRMGGDRDSGVREASSQVCQSSGGHGGVLLGMFLAFAITGTVPCSQCLGNEYRGAIPTLIAHAKPSDPSSHSFKPY